MVESGLLAGPKDLKAAARPRSLFGSKRSNGMALVIGGSSDYHGAPVLASSAAYNTLAALRIGTGYAFLYVPSSIQDVTRVLSPSLIVRPFGRKEIGQGKIHSIKDTLNKADSIVIGMGIGRSPRTLKMAAEIISLGIRLNKKMVIDADAIYSLKHVRKLNRNVVVTPQATEFSSLSGVLLEKRSLNKRIEASLRLARKIDCCILLKGHQTVVTNGASVRVVESKSSALATMGTGDVLSGIIGGYAATGTDTFKAAVAGAYLHARIGDLLAREKGNHILSSDVVERIPAVIKEFDSSAST